MPRIDKMMPTLSVQVKTEVEVHLPVRIKSEVKKVTGRRLDFDACMLQIQQQQAEILAIKNRARKNGGYFPCPNCSQYFKKPETFQFHLENACPQTARVDNLQQEVNNNVNRHSDRNPPSNLTSSDNKIRRSTRSKKIRIASPSSFPEEKTQKKTQIMESQPRQSQVTSSSFQKLTFDPYNDSLPDLPFKLVANYDSDHSSGPDEWSTAAYYMGALPEEGIVEPEVGQAVSTIKIEMADREEIMRNIREDIDKDGIKNYECTICWKFFEKRLGAFKHVKIVHFKQGCICTLCNRSLYDARQLRRHQTTCNGQGKEYYDRH